MIGFETLTARDDDFAAQVTEIAYDVLLRQGLTRSFLDVELELWQQIRAALPVQIVRPERLLEVA